MHAWRHCCNSFQNNHVSTLIVPDLEGSVDTMLIVEVILLWNIKIQITFEILMSPAASNMLPLTRFNNISILLICRRLFKKGFSRTKSLPEFYRHACINVNFINSNHLKKVSFHLNINEKDGTYNKNKIKTTKWNNHN